MTEDLVTVGSYENPLEANLVRSELDAFGIDATLSDDGAIGVNWLWSNALGGVKVQVPQPQVDEARQLLDTAPSEEVTERNREDPVCPNCGSANTHFFLDKRACFVTWLILGVPVFPALSRTVCPDCGHRWKR